MAESFMSASGHVTELRAQIEVLLTALLKAALLAKFLSNCLAQVAGFKGSTFINRSFALRKS